MPCYKPLKAIHLGKKLNGKKRLQFVTAFCKENHIPIPYNEETFLDFAKGRDNIMEIPCGQCIGCRLEYSRQWAMRVLEEAKNYEHNHFITLTYNELFLATLCQSAQLTSREIIVPTASLIKKDLQKFIKDLRRYWEYHFNHDGIRFFACGEYGEQYQRPHYHIAIFNLPIPDLKFYKLTATKEPLFTSKIIESIWGKGFAPIGAVTWNSAAYIARYVTKKIKGPQADEYYKQLGVIPEFTNMSRRPGIGREAFDKIMAGEISYGEAKMLVKTNKGVQALKPARYYDKLYDNFNPDDMERIKAERKTKGETSEIIRKQKTALDEFQYRQVQEENVKARIKILGRNNME